VARKVAGYCNLARKADAPAEDEKHTVARDLRKKGRR